MDRFRFILTSLALTCSLFGISCGSRQATTNKLPPRMTEPSPTANRNADVANTSGEPQTSPSNERNEKKFCQVDNPAGTRQKCIFVLDSYKEAEYQHDDIEALNLYTSRIVGYIEEALYSKECSVLSITAWGYADSLKLNAKLKWADVPESCRSPETCRQGDLNAEYLTNDDLACVRECLVKNRIYARLEQNVDIISKDWNSEHRFYTGAEEVGDPFRKVEIILERGGKCPDD
jgi:hypothetical protein